MTKLSQKDFKFKEYYDTDDIFYEFKLGREYRLWYHFLVRKQF